MSLLWLYENTHMDWEDTEELEHFVKIGFVK